MSGILFSYQLWINILELIWDLYLFFQKPSQIAQWKMMSPNYKDPIENANKNTTGNI